MHHPTGKALAAHPHIVDRPKPARRENSTKETPMTGPRRRIIPLVTPADEDRGERRPGDTRSLRADARDADADAREAAADERSASADMRELAGDARGVEADSREVSADAREATADAREATADRRSSSADMRELVVDARGAEADSREISADAREAAADAREAAAEARDSAADARDAADARRPVSDLGHPDAAGEAGAGMKRMGAPQIVVIDSQSRSACAVCGASFGRASDHDVMHDFEQRVNHLLSEHNATLQHVGPHTGKSSEGDVFHHVVAVLGLPH